jgi:hypothetical protein
MRKIILLIMMALSIGITVKSQELKYGIIAGYNLSSASDFDSQSGFHAGVKGELLFHKVDGLYMNLGLIIRSSGLKSSGYYFSDDEYSANWKYRFYDLNIPIHIGYKFNVANKIRLFVNAGPYVSIGLFGKVKENAILADGSSNEYTVSDNIYNDELAKRIEYGVGFRIGTEVNNHIQASIGYDFGMKNVIKQINSKRNMLTVSCAYIF